MKYYKQNNEVYAYELDGSQDHLIHDKVAMTVEEVEAHVNPPKTVEQVKEAKRIQIRQAYDTAVKAMVGDTDSTEMSSWTKQEAEARAWTTDNLVATPIIDNLLLGRNMGETKEELVLKIIGKADMYAVAYAQVLGQYHSKQKLLAMALTIEEVEVV